MCVYSIRMRLRLRKRQTKSKKLPPKSNKKRTPKSNRKKTIKIMESEVSVKTIRYDTRTGKINPMNLTKKSIVCGIVHANWCGHCKQLMDKPSEAQNSIWQDTETLLREEANTCEKSRDINIINMESDADRELIEKFDRIYGDNKLFDRFVPSSFPTIVRIHGGNLEMYQGERTPRAMVDWFLMKPAEPNQTVE